MTAAMMASMRALVDRTPLRVKLVASMLVLAALGLFGAGTASLASLERYLMRQVDDQLRHSADAVARFPETRSFPQTGPMGHGPFQETPPTGGENLPRPRERPALAVPFYSRVFTAAGVPLGNDDGLKTPDFGGHRAPPQLPVFDQTALRELADHPFTAEATDGGGEWRVLARGTRTGDTVVVALGLDQVGDTIGHVTIAELSVGVVVLLMMGALGQLSVKSSLRPLMRVESTAAAIADGDLSRRVPPGNASTEVGRLAIALNLMLAQIEAAFAERQAAVAAARAAEAAARTSERTMRRFVADASHELRTPLTTIRGFAELLRRQSTIDSDQIPTTTDRIEAATIRMTSLVEDLLLLARLDQQRPVPRQPVDLLAVVTDAVIDFQTTTSDHPVRLTVAAGTASRPPVVIGDETRLRQIVTNLLSNAGTHTPAGTAVTVTVTTSGDYAVFTVADAGPGIPADVVGKIFERFYRVDGSRTRARGGAGLGLSIVAALVAAHGGTVRAESAVGTGTTFEVTLPLYQDPKCEPLSAEPAA